MALSGDRRRRILYPSLLALVAAALLPIAPLDAAAQPMPAALAQFTTGVENREPVDQVTFVESGVTKIFFFTELRNLAGERVTHRWSYRGKVVAEVGFDVGGPRWRVWSTKDLDPEWIGDWTVEVVRGNGEVVAAETFTYTAPGA